MMKKLIITEEEKKEILNLHQFKKFLLEASEHSENLFKSWANKKSGNPELALSLMDDFFNFQKQLPKKDFAQYKTAEELKTDIDKLKSQPKKPEEDADVIYKDNNLLVVATKTWEAGCKYGSGTKWCTSSKDESSYWYRHNSTGTEFIWITKNLPQNNPLHKVSLHFKEDNRGGTHDWCTAINNCGYDNPYKKKNINIPNFDEIFKKCEEYHLNRFVEKIKDREEKRKNLVTLPVYTQSIEFLNNLIENLNNYEDVLYELSGRMIDYLKNDDEITIDFDDLDPKECYKIENFIYNIINSWLNSEESQNILNHTENDIKQYIFDIIDRNPDINLSLVQDKIITEIIEILSEDSYFYMKDKIISEFPYLFNDY